QQHKSRDLADERMAGLRHVTLPSFGGRVAADIHRSGPTPATCISLNFVPASVGNFVPGAASAHGHQAMRESLLGLLGKANKGVLPIKWRAAAFVVLLRSNPALVAPERRRSAHT